MEIHFVTATTVFTRPTNSKKTQTLPECYLTMEIEQQQQQLED